MHSIWVPTDNDHHQYPHVCFTSPDIWDASVLDYGTTPALLEEIHQEADDTLLKDSILMNLEIFTNDQSTTWMFTGTQAPQRL